MFIAIDLPKPVGWELGRLVAEPPRGVRPVRPAQLHLTLHFLGDVADDAFPAVHRAVAGVRQAPFVLVIRGTGVFPPRGRPTVLWAGVAESPPLACLWAAVGTALEACGLEVERRPYTPHITLARLTPAVPRAWTARVLDETARLEMPGLPVDRFLLYESRKLDGATEHAIAATYPLHT